MLMVTHNPAQARRLADAGAVCWVENGCGCVVESGATEHIFAAPGHPVTQARLPGARLSGRSRHFAGKSLDKPDE